MSEDVMPDNADGPGLDLVVTDLSDAERAVATRAIEIYQKLEQSQGFDSAPGCCCSAVGETEAVTAGRSGGFAEGGSA
ncbi:hypothetical protein SAMN05421678_11843 [Actinopolymorpha cephalotaxi]|uniref:Uncharacterized protein n=1 Tax=Actinopolymorpha cephalotaxi TaxID=504797 RepID=A0A1I3A4X5_9ACTN|nr:hypothetical protein [Actinopolymorpha cephalotaxi]NYH85344.1 hypothetical protein [Actinopolymorpha cephalotaxi]SFH45058.1 hypothetical protein SAMN05421678_11843 [Actinopolymorpha cephalotaxi]